MAKEPQATEPNPNTPPAPAPVPEPVPQPPQPEGFTTTGAPVDERFVNLPPGQRMQTLPGDEENPVPFRGEEEPQEETKDDDDEKSSKSKKRR